MEEERIKEFSNIIVSLNDKYKDNVYMIQRLENHLTNLPTILEQECKKNDERVTRYNELTIEQENFYNIFLSKYKYYYMSYNNLFYEYDGKTYRIVKEDDIHYKLLSTITDEGKLIQWKHKTKQNIIKKIKERSLFKSTPETYTIQNVLGFLLTLFKSKAEAKYFLTIIGDCIMKKNVEPDNLIYFVSSTMKKFIGLIDSIIYNTIGISIRNNFITKYQKNHRINMYRLIKINESTNSLSVDIVKNILNDIGLDLLCVAVHYSDRYNNADNYLKLTNDDMKEYVLYFENNHLDSIVDNFFNKCIEKSAFNNHKIQWKNMHYLWKQYLSSINLPNVVYSSDLQNILSLKLSFDIEANGNIVFNDVTSKYLPDVSLFLNFWDKHISITDDETDEYEIDELINIYKTMEKRNNHFSENDILNLISHFYSPNVVICHDKYIKNISCNLWLKKDDLMNFLNDYKDIYTRNKESNYEVLVSFDELYNMYKQNMNAKSFVEQRQTQIVSKQYFEKYMMNNLNKFVVYDNFLSVNEWLNE